MTILLEMMEWAFRGVDRDMREVRATQPFDLRVEIGEVPPCSSGSLEKSMPGGTILGHEGDLLGLGEEILGHPVEHEAADRFRAGSTSSGMSLVGSRTSKSKAVCEVLIERWSTVPIRESRRLDRVPEVATVEIGIGAVDLDGLVPDYRLQAELGLPVNLTKVDSPSR
jgi:hypothetical protein